MASMSAPYKKNGLSPLFYGVGGLLFFRGVFGGLCVTRLLHELRRDGGPVGGLRRIAVEHLLLGVVVADVLHGAVNHVAARIDAELVIADGDRGKVGELLHGEGGRRGRGLLEDLLGGRGRGRGRGLNGGRGLAGGGELLGRNGRRALGGDGGLLLVALGRGLLALLLLARHRARVRDGRAGGGARLGGLLGARRLHGALPGLKGLEHLVVGPGGVGLLVLEHGAEGLDHGGGAAEVLSARLVGGAGGLEQVADALREDDPVVGGLLGRIGVLLLLRLDGRDGRTGRDGGLELGELGLERLDLLHGGGGHFEGWRALEVCSVLSAGVETFSAPRPFNFSFGPPAGGARRRPE